MTTLPTIVSLSGPYVFGVDPEAGFEVRSLGPDGIKGSEDDLP